MNDHPTDKFHGQFVLAPTAGPESWPTDSLSGWTLSAHPDLPVHRLLTRDGRHVGWLLGHAVSEQGLLVSEDVTLDGAADELSAEAIEENVYAFGGRFAAIVNSGGIRRVYLDPAGTLAAVYSVREPILASTASLLATVATEPHPLDETLTQTLGPDRFFPAGLTPYTGVQRLLPNHYLDLERWTALRHWLHRSLKRVADEQVGHNVETIAHGIRRNIGAVCARHTTYLGLTAGKDSRMILACSRDFLPDIRAMTFDYGGGGLDLEMARHIARKFNLQHQVVPVTEVSPERRRWYLERIGYAGGHGKVRDFYVACQEHLDTGCAFLTGFTGEVGRQFYRFGNSDSKQTPEPPEVLNLLGLPATQPFCEAVETWLADTRCEDRRSLTAQAYLELRVGCWASPHMYGAAPFAVNLTPFCHRDIYAAMLSLPLHYWRSHHVAEGVVRSQWPQLASVPYGRGPGLTGLARHAGKRIRQKVAGALNQ